MKGIDSKLNVCDFLEPKVDKVPIVRIAYFLPIGVYLCVKERYEISLKVLSLASTQPELGMR